MQGLHTIKHEIRVLPYDLDKLPAWVMPLKFEIFSELTDKDEKLFMETLQSVMNVSPDISDVRRKMSILRQQANLRRIAHVRDNDALICARTCRMLVQDVIYWHQDGEPRLQRQRQLKDALRDMLSIVIAPTLRPALRSAYASIFAADPAEPFEMAASAMWASMTAAWAAMSKCGSPIGQAEAEKAAEFAIVEHYRWEAEALLRLFSEARCFTEGRIEHEPTHHH